MSPRRAFWHGLIGLCWLLAASLSQAAERHPKDPWEGYNRAVFAFNEAMDQAVLKPVAVGYRKHVPQPARDGVSNFFGNLGDVWSTVNLLLQGKVVDSARMTLRVATNSIFGLGGVLDPASEMGLEKHSEDFGQTLGFWGVPSGPYVVLPLLGPSTLRDALATPIDLRVDPLGELREGSAYVSLTGLRLINQRASLMAAERLLNDVALDRYQFVRDGYLARRRNLVYDGDPPPEPEEPEEPAAAADAPPDVPTAAASAAAAS